MSYSNSASVSEQLVSNLSWKSLSEAKDLHKRILFTLGAFIVYRLGTYIPLPGIDPVAMQELAKGYTRGFLGMFNLVSGGALERMSIFVLNLVPYISTSIMVQLMTAIFPSFIALKKEGESGKQKLNQYTRYGTIALATVQAMGVASMLTAQRLVYDAGIFFYISTLLTIVGSTLFLMWLGEQITARGIGNGSSMIIYAGIIASLPKTILHALELGRTEGLSPVMMLVCLAGVFAIIGFIVFMERAYRKVVVQYPRGSAQVYGAKQSHIPIKINTTGVLPPIFAVTLLGFFRFLGDVPLVKNIPLFKELLAVLFAEGSIVSMMIQVMLIIFFAFFYTGIVFNTKETAENLKKGGAFIPGYTPGERTDQYLTYVINRITVLGSVYIAFVVILPGLLNRIFGLDFPFQGTSFLISVSVSLEIISQVYSYLISHRYGGFLRQGHVSGKGKKKR